MEKKLFCEHCNEEVLTYTVLKDNREEVCCLYCGLPLQKRIVEHSTTQEVFLHADDSPFMRELVRDIAIKNHLCRDVLTFQNGEQLLTFYTKSLLKGEGSSLIILDIRMPILSGLSTAVAIRAVESALEKKKTPILFFSVKEADEELKKFINHTAPSFYLNKGASHDIEDLEKRLVYAFKAITAKY